MFGGENDRHESKEEDGEEERENLEEGGVEELGKDNQWRPAGGHAQGASSILRRSGRSTKGQHPARNGGTTEGTTGKGKKGGNSANKSWRTPIEREGDSSKSSRSGLSFSEDTDFSTKGRPAPASSKRKKMGREEDSEVDEQEIKEEIPKPKNKWFY